MHLSREEVRAALFGLDTLVRERSIAGRPCPREVVALRDRLTAAYQSVSPTRQKQQAIQRESDAWNTRIGTSEAAAMLGATPRWVQRHAEDLGGELIAGRWLFPERNITDIRNRL